ncbi:MAG: segregation/condensation protein A [Alphaproteobacteria bacterium]|nr:segregation/condensation protein A [Alphaproteobacteria bacterium]
MKKNLPEIVQDNVEGSTISQDQEAVPDVGKCETKDEVDQLLLNLDGYEGPIDILLELSRNQKVDLAKISILQLVRQYLVFIERANQHNLELAAEYLVMAAWMAYLKSRLFLPKEENSEEPSAEAMAEALQFQLRRLEAMQNVAEKLLECPRLGVDVFARGQGEDSEVFEATIVTDRQISLLDLLQAYGAIEQRKSCQKYDLPVFNLMSAEKALKRLGKMLGALPRKGSKSAWATLQSFLPESPDNPLYTRSVLASTFTAGLELARQGSLEFRQEGSFRPVYLRVSDDIEGKENKKEE